MIVLKLIDNNGILMPERELTNNEKISVTSTLLNVVNAIYYQGDEPKDDEPKDDSTT